MCHACANSARRAAELSEGSLSETRSALKMPVRIIFAAAREQPLVLARLEQMISDYSGWIFAHAGAKLERKPKPPSAEVLQDLRLPALVVVGELDLPDFQDMADEVVRRLPGARKVVLEGAGHLCNMEAPASFNRVLLEFLSTAE